MALRKCWRYVAVECSLADVKKGDFYQLGKLDDEDLHDPSQVFYAHEDAHPKRDGLPGSEVMASRFIEDPTFEKDEKFSEAMRYGFPNGA